ncbi:MAG: PilZ domain-containing protein [Erythrobacter sp.]
MDNAADFSRKTDTGGAELASDAPVAVDRRCTKRQNLLIRVAKLISAQGEFVCVVRDYSEMGVSIRLFHAIPMSKELELEMPTGNCYKINLVRSEGEEVGFTFSGTIDTEEFARAFGDHPKRPLRLGIYFPVRLNTLSQSTEATVGNLSQQGARLDGGMQFALDQNVRIEGCDGAEAFGEVRAKVRWRGDEQCGVVFDDTMTLREFARLAAKLQAPALLDDSG